MVLIKNYLSPVLYYRHLMKGFVVVIKEVAGPWSRHSTCPRKLFYAHVHVYQIFSVLDVGAKQVILGSMLNNVAV